MTHESWFTMKKTERFKRLYPSSKGKTVSQLSFYKDSFGIK